MQYSDDEKGLLKVDEEQIQVNDLHFYIKFQSSTSVSTNFTGTIQLPGLSISTTLAANWLKLINLYM